jgi:hypothetical protein
MGGPSSLPRTAGRAHRRRRMEDNNGPLRAEGLDAVSVAAADHDVLKGHGEAAVAARPNPPHPATIQRHGHALERLEMDPAHRERLQGAELERWPGRRGRRRSKCQSANHRDQTPYPHVQIVTETVVRSSLARSERRALRVPGRRRRARPRADGLERASAIERLRHSTTSSPEKRASHQRRSSSDTRLTSGAANAGMAIALLSPRNALISRTRRGILSAPHRNGKYALIVRPRGASAPPQIPRQQPASDRPGQAFPRWGSRVIRQR